MKVEAPKKKTTEFSPAIFQLMDAGYFDTGCSDVQLRILHEIYINGGCSAASIEKKLHINKGYVSRIIRDFEKEGYISKQQSTDDRRFFHLFLTEKGVTYTEEHMRTATASVAKKIRSLNEIDKQKLLEASKK